MGLVGLMCAIKSLQEPDADERGNTAAFTSLKLYKLH